MRQSARTASILIGTILSSFAFAGAGERAVQETQPAPTSSHPAGVSGAPDLAIDRDGSVSSVVLAARKARQTVPCRKCDGARKVVKKKKVGENRLPGLTQNVYEEVEADCDACRAGGYNDLKWIVSTDRRVGVVDRYIDAAARLDPEDAKAGEVINDTRKELDELMAINPVDWTNRVVNPQAKRRFSAVSLEVGEPVIAVGMLLNDQHATGDGPPLRRIKLIEYRISPSDFMTQYNTNSLRMVAEHWISRGLVAVIDQPEILVRDPILVDAIPGEIVMVTGLIAGNAAEGAPRRPVLQHGFVITPRPELAFDDN